MIKSRENQSINLSLSPSIFWAVSPLLFSLTSTWIPSLSFFIPVILNLNSTPSRYPRKNFGLLVKNIQKARTLPAPSTSWDPLALTCKLETLNFLQLLADVLRLGDQDSQGNLWLPGSQGYWTISFSHLPPIKLPKSRDLAAISSLYPPACTLEFVRIPCHPVQL